MAGMRLRWTIEADLPDSARPSAATAQLDALIGLFSQGKVWVSEAHVLETEDPVDADVVSCEVVRPVLHIVPQSA